MEKIKYEKPTIESIAFATADILMTSSGFEGETIKFEISSLLK